MVETPRADIYRDSSLAWNFHASTDVSNWLLQWAPQL